MSGWRRWVAAALEWRAPLLAPRLVPSFGLLGSPARRVTLPGGLAVVGVGGATLGGSGRTPLAIGVARALAGRGHRVVFVGHGYGGRCPRALRVSASDPVALVGDEALLAARALDVPVVVGPRDETLRLAASLGEVAVVDRLLQARPRRLACSLLAVDDVHPWGSGRPFPLGDLLASPRRLESLADHVVRVGGEEAPAVCQLSAPLPPGTWGLVTSCARPDRVARSAASLGAVAFHVKRPDHQAWHGGELARLRRLARAHDLRGWLLDAKSAVLLPAHDVDLGAPRAEILHDVRPTDLLVDRIEASLR